MILFLQVLMILAMVIELCLRLYDVVDALRRKVEEGKPSKNLDTTSALLRGAGKVDDLGSLLSKLDSLTMTRLSQSLATLYALDADRDHPERALYRSSIQSLKVSFGVAAPQSDTSRWSCA